MTDLYTRDEAQALEKRAGAAAAVAAVCAVASLAVCVALCARVTTLSALRLQWAAVGVSTLGGWAAILLVCLVSLPSRVQARHTRWMLQGERTEASGDMHLDSTRIQIPRSIEIRRVLLTQGGETAVLNVFAEKAALLPGEGTRVRVMAVGRYVVAWEALHENNENA